MIPFGKKERKGEIFFPQNLIFRLYCELWNYLGLVSQLFLCQRFFVRSAKTLPIVDESSDCVVYDFSSTAIAQVRGIPVQHICEF